ncbi:MAG: hypothetical protein AB2603_11110 [Candidatus Thiodiazotropha endolucinida]
MFANHVLKNACSSTLMVLVSMSLIACSGVFSSEPPEEVRFKMAKGSGISTAPPAKSYLLQCAKHNNAYLCGHCIVSHITYNDAFVVEAKTIDVRFFENPNKVSGWDYSNKKTTDKERIKVPREPQPVTMTALIGGGVSKPTPEEINEVKQALVKADEWCQGKL